MDTVGDMNWLPAEWSPRIVIHFSTPYFIPLQQEAVSGILFLSVSMSVGQSVGESVNIVLEAGAEF
jgi:hypothetical protein